VSARVAIVTDSTADLESLGGSDVTVVPLTVTFGSKQFRDGVDLHADEFYRRLASDPNHPVTAQPPPDAFANAYRSLLDAGAEHVISLHLSSSLSGTYNSALLGAQQVDAARVTVMDTRNVSAGLGLLVLAARDQAARGESVQAIVDHVNADIPRDQLFAAIPSLTYLARGGRIGALQSVLGNVLQIVPIITLKDGLVGEHSRVRTFARAVDQIIALVAERIPQKGTARCGVMHTVAPQLAATVAQRIKERCEPASLFITSAGPTVGTHAGPGAVGVFFIP
jgi:DegV family protein with EDD domain